MDDIEAQLAELDNKKEKRKQSVKTIITDEVEKQKNMNIETDKHFKEHLQQKLNKLDIRLKILQMKYNNYKKWYDGFNISIIIVSSLLSIFEASRNELKDHIEKDSPTYIFFNLIPIGISSYITCSAAIIKFKKYQEKMENMQFTREKVLLSISKIKHVQEKLWFSSPDNFDNMKKIYLDEVYLFYNESNAELERHIKYNDNIKFKKHIHKKIEQEKKIKFENI
jgi:hypothetical protein